MAYFNQTEYDLNSSPINESTGAKLGTAWMSLPLAQFYFNESHLDILSAVSITVDFKGVIFDSSPIPLLGSRTQSYVNLGIAGQVVTSGGSGWIDNLQLSMEDVVTCGEYVLLPIDVLVGSGFAGVGINQFSMSVYFYHNENESLHFPDTTLSIVVYSGEYVGKFELELLKLFAIQFSCSLHVLPSKLHVLYCS